MDEYTEEDLHAKVRRLLKVIASHGEPSWAIAAAQVIDLVRDFDKGAGRLRTADDDKAIRERDSLVRRLSVRFGELEDARAALRQMTDERDAARAGRLPGGWADAVRRVRDLCDAAEAVGAGHNITVGEIREALDGGDR